MDLKNIIPKELLTSKIIPKEITAYVNHIIDSKLIQYEKWETNHENKASAGVNNKDKINKMLQDRLSRQKKNINYELLNNNIVSILKTQVKASIKLFQEVNLINKKIQIQSAQIEELIRTKGESALTDKQLEALITAKIQSLQDDIEANHKINPKDNILDRTTINLPGINNNKPLVEEKKKGSGILDMLNNFGSGGFKAIAAMLLASLGPVGLALPALLLLAPLVPYVSTMFKMVKWFLKMGFGTLNTLNKWASGPLENMLYPDRKKKFDKDSVKRKMKKLNIAARRKVQSVQNKASSILSKAISKVSPGISVLSKVTSSTGSTIAKVGESISSFGSSAWGVIKSKSSTIYDSVKAMANRLLPFFTRMMGNPPLRNEFVKRLGVRIGASRVASFMGKLAISGTGIGSVMLLWALYDVYDVSREIYETVNELNGVTEFSSTSVTSKYTSSDVATYMGKDTSYAQEYDAGYKPGYVKSYNAPTQKYSPFNPQSYMSTNNNVQKGELFTKRVQRKASTYMSMGTISPSLVSLVKSNEGFKSYYYPDAHGYSIGYGHFAKGSGAVPVSIILGYEPPNGTITRDEAEKLLQYDLEKAKKGAFSAYPWLAKQPQIVQNHIIDMTYNLGVGGIQDFAPTMAHIEKGEYEVAANRLTKTKWYSQVGDRSQRIVNDLRQLGISNVNKIEENASGISNDSNNTTNGNTNAPDQISDSTTIKQNSSLVNTLNNQPSNDSDVDVEGYIKNIGNESKIQKLFNNSKTEVVKPTNDLKSPTVSKEDEEYFKSDTSYSTVKKPTSTFLNKVTPESMQSSGNITNNSSANNTFNNTSALLMNNDKQSSVPMIYKSSFS